MNILGCYLRCAWHDLERALRRPCVSVPLIVGVALLLAAAEPVLAQVAPWERPICMVARSLSGPVAKAVAIIAIVITGLLIAFSEVGGLFKTLLGLLGGASFALLADQWLGFIRTGAGSECYSGALDGPAYAQAATDLAAAAVHALAGIV
jgi:type IV secretion system protein VirB2